MIGRIHSIETMGLVDGPGVRCVVFMQGCSLRCRYCHNPDTWALSGGTEMSADELIQKVLRFRPYYQNGGGVTFSGGEPLMQPEFLLEVLRICKKNGLHTCLDTAGVGLGQYEEIVRETDLVLFDAKHVTEEGYRKMTGRPSEESQRFLASVARAGVPIWIRHVIVPGLTDGREHLEKLRTIIQKIPRVERVELLPYHKMGVHKYKELGISYPLDGIPEMDPAAVCKMQEKLLGSMAKEEL